ncbi:MAG: hypothetical protein J6W58_07625 [Lachnospiraceae bacterium]|nr:hypothetical protein [Lachnospiraceae bacterium]
MKRLIYILLAAALVMTGCGNRNETESANDSTEQNTYEQEEIKTVNEYSNDLLKIQIPDDIADIVKVDVEDDKISVYDRESADAGFGGLVFIVWARPVDSGMGGGPYVKIGELSNENADIYEVVKGYATEIQWDYNLADMPANFAKIYDSAEGIINGMTGNNGYTFIPGAGTKGEDLYNSVLSKYVTAKNKNWDASRYEAELMSSEFYNTPLEAIGYAYLDVNLDGIDELFVGEFGEDDLKGVVYDIYTMVKGKPAHVISGSARNRFYAHSDGLIVNEWSGGAALSGFDVYNLEADSIELVYQWGYKYDGYEDEDKPWFKSYDGNEYESVTEEDAKEAYMIGDKYVRFDYKRLSDNTDAIAAAQYEGVADQPVNALPKYEYPGPEQFYSEVYRYIIDEFSGNYEPADVSIPSPVIVKEDVLDGGDIDLYGDFWLYNYNLNADTLECVSGGSYPGCMHIIKGENGYEVKSFDQVGDGSDYEPSAKKIFKEYYNDLIKAQADEEKKQKDRAQIIANYAAANSLDIRQYRDYGWDPVLLPEENIDSFYSVLD